MNPEFCKYFTNHIITCKLQQFDKILNNIVASEKLFILEYHNDYVESSKPRDVSR